ncbi:MAG: helix-turn-helix domain-containing protein [Alphaproteobacteria bacterium]|nr:MAG: helix-turn-helix domain-containing protein [Alphaproteobacteria bacterium]
MAITEIMSIADVFALLGGNSAVARALGVGQSTTSEMKRRGRIPAEYWFDLLRMARKHGHPEVTAELLVSLHARSAADEMPAGLSEEGKQWERDAPAQAKEPPPSGEGHFSRFRHLRRNHFRTLEEINDHVAALREEWDHR